MDTNGTPIGSQPVPSHNYNNIFINNNFNAYQQAPPNRARLVEPDTEDEPDELKPQYSIPPQCQAFLSASKISRHYTELQVAVGSAFRRSPVPRCDNYRSHRNLASQPIVYVCQQCIPHRDRHLCKKCAQKEMSFDSSLHNPDHPLRKWQPTWHYDLARTMLEAPVVTPDMESFIDQEIPDDFRNLTFESSKYYDDRAFQLFLPAPPGQCHMVMYIQVHPIKNEKRELDIWDKAKGMVKFSGMFEIFGSIGASAYPGMSKSPRTEPGEATDEEPPKKWKKGEYGSSRRIDLKRGDNFQKPYMLDVYVNVKASQQQDMVVVVLKDEYYKSDQYYDRPFRWTLKSVSITPILRPAPPFASLGQIAQHNKNKRREKAEEEQQKRDVTKDHLEYIDSVNKKDQEKEKKYMEEAQEHRFNINQQPEPPRGRIRVRNQDQYLLNLHPHIDPDHQRPTSMPSQARNTFASQSPHPNPHLQPHQPPVLANPTFPNLTSHHDNIPYRSRPHSETNNPTGPGTSTSPSRGRPQIRLRTPSPPAHPHYPSSSTSRPPPHHERLAPTNPRPIATKLRPSRSLSPPRRTGFKSGRSGSVGWGGSAVGSAGTSSVGSKGSRGSSAARKPAGKTAAKPAGTGMGMGMGMGMGLGKKTGFGTGAGARAGGRYKR